MKRIIILFISIFVLLIVYVSTPSVSEEQMRTLFYEYIQRTFKEEYKKFKIISDVDLTVPGNQYHRGYAGYGKTGTGREKGIQGTCPDPAGQCAWS